MKPSLLISIVAAVFVLWLSGVSAGETIYVDAVGGGDFTSIQAAIDNAANGDEIVVAPGTYPEAINFLGKAVHVYSTGGPEVTIINAAGLDTSVVICSSGEGVGTILEGFTLTGGNSFSGGGMYNYYSSPAVKNCIFTGNSASNSGGGMYNSNSSPTLIDCTFTNNLSLSSSDFGGGGGMYNYNSSPTLVNCTFTGNSTGTASGRLRGGGGMYNSSSGPTLIDCVFINNSTNNYGGGIYNSHGSPTITNCTFIGNSAYWGGGAYNTNSSMTLTGCTFDANSAFRGGGLWIGGWTENSATVTNSIFHDNSATYGGGMYFNGTSPKVTNCTLFSNTATGLSGVLHNDGDSTPTVTNSILWNNAPQAIYDPGSTVTAAYSNIQLYDWSEVWPGTGNMNMYPMFVDAAGGDLRLRRYSACIDAGSNDAPGLPAADKAGNSRVIDGLGDGMAVADMGAYEYDGAPPPAATGTLSVTIEPAAVVAAGAMWRIEGDQDWFASGASVELTPGDYTLEFTEFADWFEPHRVSVGYDENDPNKVVVRNLRVRVIGDMTAAVEADYVPLPVYAIGQVPSIQTPHGLLREFWVEAPWLGGDVQFSVAPLSPAPSGTVSIDPDSGHFTYEPHPDDRMVFEVTLTATSGAGSDEQTIRITPLPEPLPEYAIVGRPDQPVQDFPDLVDYVFVNEMRSDGPEYLNGSQWNTVRSVTVSGIELAVELVTGNLFNGFHTNRDIKALTIYAETLIIRDSLWLPQTEVTIYARELIFEDNGVNGPAQIITTPMPSGSHAAGLDAGNVHLFVEAYVAAGGLGARFVMNDAPGSSAGAYGQGGVLTCSLDDAAPLGWLSPYALKAVIAHARDAYLYGYWDQTRQILEDYDDLLALYIGRPEWQGLSATWRFEIEQLRQEIIMLMHRLDNDFDYFGNPHNWVPALSFEVLKTVYEQEIDHAIRALYLAHWLNNVADDAQKKAAGLTNARSRLWQETLLLRDQYATLTALITPLKQRAAAIEASIGRADSGGCFGLLCELRQKEADLLRTANVNVEKSRDVPEWKMVLDYFATVATYTFTGASTASKPGAVLGYFGGMAVATQDMLKYADPWEEAGSVTDVARTFNRINFDQAADDWIGPFGGSDPIDLQKLETHGANAYLESLRLAASDMAGGLWEVKEALQTTRLNDEEVDAELKRIKAADPAFGSLIDKVVALKVEKELFNQQLAAVVQQVTTLSNAMTNNMLAIDAMNRQAGDLNRNYDPRVVMYVRDMEQRARARLKKYHYYMAKAYEYRLLKPYPNDLNIQTITDEMIGLASTDGTLTSTQFNDILRPAYENQLRDLAETILDEFFMDGNVEYNSEISYALSSEEIDRLNAGEPLTLNLFDRGLFLTGRENIRIIRIRVADDISVSVTGGCGSFGNINLKMHHPSVSKLQWKGDVYEFRHLSPNTHKPLNVLWESDYDVLWDDMFHPVVSASSQSLLWSLLSEADRSNALIYSRPGVWADVVITKEDNSDWGCSMDIEAMRLIVEYDYYSKDPDFRTLRVTTEPKALNPYFRLNTPDLSGRRDGMGNIYRIYNSWQEVEVTAPQTYGYWRFDRWTNQQGVTLPLPDQSARTVFLSQGHQTIRANYVYDGPLLSIGDFDKNYWVDYYDFEAMARVWMTTPAHPDWDARFDISDSGSVGLEDLLIFLEDWLATD